jgi:hypothetical protein
MRRALAKEQRQEDGHYERHLAGEIIAMLPVAPDGGLVGAGDRRRHAECETAPREPQLPDAA